MAIFRILIFHVFLLFSSNILGQQVINQVIDKKNISLKKIIQDDQYNINMPFLISSEFQQEIIRNEDKTITPDFIEIAIKAFVKWSNKFLNDDRNYIVLRMPLLKTLLNMGNHGFKNLDGKNDIFLSGKSEIDFDPFMKNYCVSNFLNENKIIVGISMPDGGFESQRMVQINAIIPFEKMYFKYQCNYYYLLSVNHNKFKNKNNSTISKILGERLINDTEYFITDEGSVSEMFFIKNFIWEPITSKEYFSLKKINVNPSVQSLFLYDLIYNY